MASAGGNPIGFDLFVNHHSGAGGAIAPGWPLGQPIFERPIFERPSLERPILQHPILERPILQRPILQRPILQHPILERPILQPAGLSIQRYTAKFGALGPGPVELGPVVQSPLLFGAVELGPVIQSPLLFGAVEPVAFGGTSGPLQQSRLSAPRLEHSFQPIVRQTRIASFATATEPEPPAERVPCPGHPVRAFVLTASITITH